LYKKGIYNKKEPEESCKVFHLKQIIAGLMFALCGTSRIYVGGDKFI
jgi:hypothetical protein